jgi:hypothetical protein
MFTRIINNRISIAIKTKLITLINKFVNKPIFQTPLIKCRTKVIITSKKIIIKMVKATGFEIPVNSIRISHASSRVEASRQLADFRLGAVFLGFEGFFFLEIFVFMIFHITYLHIFYRIS